MSIASSVPPGIIVLLSALPLAGVLVLLFVRHRRRRQASADAEARLRDDRDFEPVFPETAADRPVRTTTIGRRIARH